MAAGAAAHAPLIAQPLVNSLLLCVALLLLLLQGPTCKYNHINAGLDWPAGDAACNWQCGGPRQSPINVPRATAYGQQLQLNRRLQADTRFGVATNLRVLNIGHAIQVEFDTPVASSSSIAICEDSIYGVYGMWNPNAQCRKPKRVNVEALQFHFHATSEHLLAGRSTQLELHIVTKLVAGPGQTLPKECQGPKPCLAVFGVLYDLIPSATATVGDRHIQAIINSLPTCAEVGRDCKQTMPGVLNLSDLLPRNSAYSTYTGSLTTPPCTQGVFDTVKATLTEAQAVALQVALSSGIYDGELMANRLNNRVTMPLNARTLYSTR